MKIAILDSERIRADRMFRSLSAAGYTCLLYRNRDRFLEAIQTHAFDILLVGVEKMEKGLSPMIQAAKEKGLKKVLILAKTAQVASVSEGLAVGADDFLCLPLRQHELQMRISVLARQIAPERGAHQHLKYGDFEFDRYPNNVKYMGEGIRLTAKEFDLALLFFRHIGMPLSRAHIAEAIWKMDGNDMARTIDTHVSRVRNKLNLKPKNGFLLEQVYGFGYQLHALNEK
ncbi:response regulator transcription factor [Oxalobacter sp. OttesenSCG-928-P03]|nr:response regulator transcription factor [Oxalobacter sp. OttesenSCG-928-P03]